MRRISVLGGAGFVGARLLDALAGRQDFHIRALQHRRFVRAAPNVTPVAGDAADPQSLDRLMSGSSTVLNLAYPGDPEALRHAEVLAAACSRAGVKRLIHASSCSVYGATSGMLVDEASACVPHTRYEWTKHAVEQLLYRQMPQACELVIVRPTAVFGPHGRNLESLARRVLLQGRLPRYVRACAMGGRRMNAVDVEGVAQALVLLASAELNSQREIFIVSDDEYQGNDYRSIEDFFIRRFSRPAYPVPVASLPQGMLRIALRAAQRSNSEPQRRYSCAKLLSLGFRKPRSFSDALEEYAAWLERQVASP